MKSLARLIKRVIPRHFRPGLQNLRILLHEYGHLQSVKTRSSVDKDGNPIPWYTYPAIEYIRQLDVRDKMVFEYGSGNSTLFWAGQAGKVVTVEDDKEWFDIVQRKLPSNATLILARDRDEYVSACTRGGSAFDIIVIDGSHRLECCRCAPPYLVQGGMMILDNSDRHSDCAAMLRHSGLIEADMAGFGPIDGSTWTTSFFFHRSFSFKPRADHQPVRGIGSRDVTGLGEERMLVHVRQNASMQTQPDT